MHRRYTVTVRGADVIRPDTASLILPNHQAMVDPQLLLCDLASRGVMPAPVVARYIYEIPGLHTLLRWISALPIGMEDGEQSVSETHAAIISHIRNGGHVVVYPSGQTQSQGYEIIGAKRTAYEVASALPNTRLIGVRISGLWGSVWSRAYTGRVPKLERVLPYSVLMMILNGIIFTPRRTVCIEYEDLTETLRSCTTRAEFNAALEHFYNINGEETARFIPHHWLFRKTSRSLPQHIEGARNRRLFTSAQVSDEVRAIVDEAIATVTDGAIQSPNASWRLDKECDLDSLQRAEVVTMVCQRFERPVVSDISRIQVVEDLYALAREHEEESPLPPYDAIHTGESSRRKISRSATILDAFFSAIQSSPASPWVFDIIRGGASARNVLMRAMIVSDIIRRATSRERVGILLPASQGAAIAILACYLCGKIPVMINWTAGHRALRHMVRCGMIDTIITARSFFSRIEQDMPKSLVSRYVYLDVEASRLSRWRILRGVVMSMMPTILHRRNIPETAVVLFTSGSESLPKAVPLTHQNILHNIQAALRVVDVRSDDILLGILPPFHSFGFTVTTILPLVAAVRVVYVPDPTDARSIVRAIAHTNATLFPTAPTFLRSVVSASADGALSSLRIILTGAEACDTALRHACQRVAPGAQIYEGYGVTECSPVVTLATTPHTGVGAPLPGVHVSVRDIQTHEECPPSQLGMIWVHGPNVFNGYECVKNTDTFRMFDHRRYYKTGDLGVLDKEGNLFLRGRLKRFVKVGGEMVSLPMIEEMISDIFPDNEDGPQYAVVSDASDHILCVTVCRDITREHINDALVRHGAPRVARVAAIRYVERIPLLGSGKVDYRTLQKNV